MIYKFITDNPYLAIEIEKFGVNRIFIDTETLGKKDRQIGFDSHFASHNLSNIQRMRDLGLKSDVLVRLNPLNDNSKNEIDNAISMGADILMFPMIKSSNDVKKIIDIVKGRVRISLLIETPSAIARIDNIFELKDFYYEIYFGLNDLHIGFGLNFMFEFLVSKVFNSIIDEVRRNNIPFGIGGIGKIGSGLLNPSLIIKEYTRLGSSRVILSRSFHTGIKLLNEGFDLDDFYYNFKQISDEFETARTLTSIELVDNFYKLKSELLKYDQ